MIRRLYPWEISDVIPIAEAFHAESALGGGFDGHILAANLQRWSATGSLYICGKFDGDRLVGALVGIISPHMMCSVSIAQELFWYVLPEHRAGRDAIGMVKDFEAWTKEHDGFACIMATFHQSDPEGRLPAVFQRLGFRAIETHHFKHL